MAEKKRPLGCVLGCLGALVVAVIALGVGLAGGGALVWLGFEPSSEEPQGAAVAVPVAVQVPVAPPVGAAAPASGAEGEDLDAARTALEEALAFGSRSQAPAPAEPGAAQAESAQAPAPAEPAPAAQPARTQPPKPEPAPAPADASGGVQVGVSGPATVTLVGAAGRFSVPGSVAPGRYEIEAAFPGEAGVVVGSLQVAAGGTYTVVCSERMGTCRAK